MKKIYGAKFPGDKISGQQVQRCRCVIPHRCPIKDPAFEGLKLSRRILKRIADIEDLIEAIAREIKRQLD